MDKEEDDEDETDNDGMDKEEDDEDETDNEEEEESDGLQSLQ